MINDNVLGSLEYGCAVAGAKVILVIGHTHCGAVTTAIELHCSGRGTEESTGCQHLEPIISQIQLSLDQGERDHFLIASHEEKEAMVDSVARRNVLRSVQQIATQSQTIRKLLRDGQVIVVGSLYHVKIGKIEILDDRDWSCGSASSGSTAGWRRHRGWSPAQAAQLQPSAA